MKARVISHSAGSADQTQPTMMSPLKRSPIARRKKSHLLTYSIIGIVSLVLIAATYFIYFAPPEFVYYTHPLSLNQIEKLFGFVYGKRSGYFLTADEKNFIADNGGESSYGEILYSTTENLLLDIFKLKEGDVLHDFGSGVGKFAIQARLTTNVSKIVATELSVTRAVLANEALEKIHNLGLLKPNDERLQFINGNFLELDISDASHIYICSTCFHDELMTNIYKKLVKEGKPGLQVVSLVMFNIPKKHKSLPKRLAYKTTHTIPMSWSNTSPGYHYVVEDDSSAEGRHVVQVEEP